MYANQLIGKLAIRTGPVDRGNQEVGFGTSSIITRNIDNSFTNNPILILAATESHIIYKYTENGKRYVLNYEFCDDKWTSWDDLMKLADEEHIELMKKLQE